jgi:Cu(I)/Ag(I) efflux system membrane fusion protein
MLIRVAALVLAFGLGVWVSQPPVPDAAADHAHETWTCSMHPEIRQSEPGACPLCGMDLIPATPVDTRATGRVVLSERARALARLQTTVVRPSADARDEVRLLGRIEPDETARKTVTAWMPGRIDRLEVDATGAEVRRGQVVARVYSPDVYGAHHDLLAALRYRDRVGADDLGAQDAVASAETRLRLLGVPRDEVEAMAAAGEPWRSVRIRSPYRGTVVERLATEGTYVETGTPLYQLADLSTVWVQLDAYETDLPRLAVGQLVRFTAQGLPGETFEGRVGFIDPILDPTTRTARVRVEVPNEDGRLRPGLFAEAVVAAGGEQAPLVVPASAPLFTGKRSVIYVEVSDPAGLGYEPRVVRLGPRLGDVYPVLEGLSDGERIVSRGAFVLDADLQIRGGDSMMRLGDDVAAERDPAVDAALAPLLEGYLAVQRALAEDDAPGAKAAAAALAEAIGATALDSDAWAAVGGPFRTRAAAVAGAEDIAAARDAFEPLSGTVEAILRSFGNPLDAPLQVAFCPMAMDYSGARWVQQGDTVDNAYFGDAMRVCGEIRETIAPGARLGR